MRTSTSGRDRMKTADGGSEMADLPSPEQQGATARRYRGQQALVTPEVVQEAVRQPAAPLLAGKPARGLRRMFWHWARWLTFWTLIALIVAAIGAHQVDGPRFSTTYST